MRGPTGPGSALASPLGPRRAEWDAGLGGAGQGVPPKKAKAAESLAAKGFKGRTVYMPDDLFERVLVQAHRRDKTISEYVVMVLERGVPDHRAPRRPGRSESVEAEGQEG